MEKSYDVIVSGGGVAGCAAALAARRAGKTVLLIEKTLVLGGLGTIGLINFFVPMDNGCGRLIIRGLCEEFVHLSRRYGWANVTEGWEAGEPTAPTPHRYCVRYSPYFFALALLEEIERAGVAMLLDSVVSGCERTGGVLTRVIVTNKSGEEAYGARMFIDATGDADLCARAGAPTVQGENYFTYIAFGATLESCARAVQKQDISCLYTGFNGGRASLYGENHPDGMRRFYGTTGEDVTDFLVRNQLEMLKTLKDDDPRTRDLTTIPTMPQLRTTRHIRGLRTLTTADVFRPAEDSVCLINDFDHRDNLYEVPLGCLLSEDADNLLAVGRAASAEGYAWDVLRVIPPAILTGQAAGVAAAQAIDEGCAVRDVSIPRLQKTLEAQNVLIHMTPDLLPKDATPGELAGAEGHL